MPSVSRSIERIFMNKKYKISPMLLADLGEVCIIEKLGHASDSAWSREAFVQELNKDYTEYFTLTNAETNTIVGFIGVWLLEGDVHIVNLVVHSNYRRQGFSKLLIQYLIDRYIKYKQETITLEVRESNMPAINLYTQYGFEVVGKRNNYYKDNGEAGLIMTKSLITEEYR